MAVYLQKEGGGSKPKLEGRVENREHKLYIGNLDPRVNEYQILQIFNPLGNVVKEEYMWHTHGNKKGEPRGYCFIEYASKEEAQRVKDKMNGKCINGRPMVIRFVDEWAPGTQPPRHAHRPNTQPIVSPAPAEATQPKPSTTVSTADNEPPKPTFNVDAKILAIKNKLRVMENETLPPPPSSLPIVLPPPPAPKPKANQRFHPYSNRPTTTATPVIINNLTNFNTPRGSTRR